MPSQGEIVLIPVPFTDLSSQKRRPVIIISNTTYNQFSKDMVVVAMTSNLSEKAYALPLLSEDLAIGALNRTSMIRTDKIYTLEQSLIVKSFGMVLPQVIDRIFDEIKSILETSK